MRGGNNNPAGNNQFAKLGTMPWIKVRFSCKETKPVRKAPGPYRAFETDPGENVVYAFVKKLSQVENLWPDAHNIEHLGAYKEIEFP